MSDVVKKIGLLLLVVILLISLGMLFIKPAEEDTEDSTLTWWEVQAIDTVKYSRDVAREKADDARYDEVIDQQTRLIANTGATHISLGAPYDSEFIPFLARWVAAARKYELNVWFRGNFSGWERWFGYERIDREEHIRLTREFVLDNGELFVDGDIFTGCTECENGGPGDPRRTGDVSGHRKFLIEEYKTTQKAFRQIGKNVRSNFFPMNGDVARLIMDKETTRALGGIVVIDHYVADPEQLSKDIIQIAGLSGGKIVLGEFGAPIPDIHGKLSPGKQALWVENALKKITSLPDLVGINYWTSFGSSTNLWNNDGSPRLVVGVLSKYYSPKKLEGKVVNGLNRPIVQALVEFGGQVATTDTQGQFEFKYVDESNKIRLSAVGYEAGEHIFNPSEGKVLFVLQKTQESLWFKLLKNLRKIF